MAPPPAKPRTPASPAVDLLWPRPDADPDAVPENPRLLTDRGAWQRTDDPRVLQAIARDNLLYGYDKATNRLGRYVPDTSLAHAVSGRDDSHYEALDPGFQQLLTDQKLDRDSYRNQVLPPYDPFAQPKWSSAQGPRKHRLGDLSMYYETGARPGQEAQAAARISDGRHDTGGKSYGAPQLSSVTGDLDAFLGAEGKPWAHYFDGLTPSIPGRTGPYENVWKHIAVRDPAFFEAQHAYIERTHYLPTLDKVRASTGLDLSSRSDAVKDVIWSMAIQHGAAPAMIAATVNGLRTPRNSPDYDRDLINALYDARIAYVSSKKVNRPDLKEKRYDSERQEALTELGGLPEPPPLPRR